MSFLPDDYKPPVGNANYFKAETGDNRIRILAAPILGHVSWVDKKPHRHRTAQECPAPSDPNDQIRHFWALPIYNYQERSIQIWEITQITILEKLTRLSRNPDWGDPTGYGITLTKVVKGDNTSYELMPGKANPLPDELANLYANTYINLEALFDNGDPFERPTSTSPPVMAATDPVTGDVIDDDGIPF